MSREKILIRTSWISTIGNAVLSVSKIIVGLLAGSLAVLGDGIDSATDVIISVVMIFTARIMSRPPSKIHKDTDGRFYDEKTYYQPGN